MQAWYPSLPVTALNDLKAAALGERWLGAGQDAESFVCLAFGTGLGSAVVLGGRVWNGRHFRAGEIGYLDYRSEDDFLEKTVSAVALIQAAGAELGEEAMDGRRFFALLRDENPVCRRHFDRWCERVARCIANLILVLDPEKVILGGGISAQGELLLPALETRVSALLPESCRGGCPIVTARCGNDAGLLGAVRQVMDSRTAVDG